MDENVSIPINHHGAQKDHTTQTALAEVQDILLENLQKNCPMALIVLDQSKCYENYRSCYFNKEIRSSGD